MVSSLWPAFHLYTAPFTLAPLSHLLYYHCFSPLPCTSWELYCVQHILTCYCLVFQCFEVGEKKKKKHPFSPSVVFFFLTFTGIQNATCLEPGLFLGSLKPISQISVTLMSLITIIKLRPYNLGKKKKTARWPFGKPRSGSVRTASFHIYTAFLYSAA